MRSAQSLTRKQVFVPGLGEVTIRIYEGKKQAIMKGTSFLVSACAETNKEAVDLLKEKYRSLMEQMQSTD